MTGREVIHKIVESVQDLDAEFPVFLVCRDSDNCVRNKEQAEHYTIINGKLTIEGGSLKRVPV